MKTKLKVSSKSIVSEVVQFRILYITKRSTITIQTVAFEATIWLGIFFLKNKKNIRVGIKPTIRDDEANNLVITPNRQRFGLAA